MLYKVIRVSLGNGKVEKIGEIHTDFIVTYFLYIENFGYLFLFRDNHCIGYMDYKNKFHFPWAGLLNIRGNDNTNVPTFEYPSSICHLKNTRICYLIEKGGSRIRTLDIVNRWAGPVCCESGNHILRRLFSKLSNKDFIETYCDIDSVGSLYWTVKDLHRCIYMNIRSSTVKSYIGSGKSGFGTSNRLDSCLLSYPRGVQVFNGALYVADHDNHCIREISNNSDKIIFGHPLKLDLQSPSQIKYRDSILYIKNNNNVHYFSTKDKTSGILYSSSKLEFIDINSKRELLILEKL